MREIVSAVMVTKVSRFDRESISESEYIDSQKEYALANYADKSDIAELNIALNKGTLIIEKVLDNNFETKYSHIVNENGFLFAVLIKGDA